MRSYKKASRIITDLLYSSCGSKSGNNYIIVYLPKPSNTLILPVRITDGVYLWFSILEFFSCYSVCCIKYSSEKLCAHSCLNSSLKSTPTQFPPFTCFSLPYVPCFYLYIYVEMCIKYVFLAHSHFGRGQPAHPKKRPLRSAQTEHSCCFIYSDTGRRIEVHSELVHYVAFLARPNYAFLSVGFKLNLVVFSLLLEKKRGIVGF